MTEAAVRQRVWREWENILLLKPELEPFSAQMAKLTETCSYHGEFPRWLQAVHDLPRIPTDYLALNQATVSVAGERGESEAVAAALFSSFQQLMPWRKGPFSIHHLLIDSEWRSDLKFQRLLDAGVDFQAKQVLDVGCGNGYFLFRILGENAACALGLDPSWLYFAQFLALQKYLSQERCVYLPFTLDDILPASFDITLSMGVLYHRRDPLQHLWQLRQTLRPGGLLILETLIVDGDGQTVFMPQSRYAGMSNVWFLPAVAALKIWLARLDFAVEYISVPVATTSVEQRRSPWINSQSLADFMLEDFSATREGLSPPKRVIILARKGGR